MWPVDLADEAFARKSLALEDSLHRDMRTLTFRFVLPRALAAKPAAALLALEKSGPPDEGRAAEVAWWRGYASGGVPSADVVAATTRYGAALDEIETRLGPARHFLCGGGDVGALSIVDIAWAINLNRLDLCGYPIAAKHPRCAALLARLRARPAVHRVLKVKMPLPLVIASLHAWQWLRGTTLLQVVNDIAL